MTRSQARELAIRYTFALSFTRESAPELLSHLLTPEAFAAWSEEDALYRTFPNAKQLGYIRDTVERVAEHAPELDGYIARYAKSWHFSRISRMAAAIMRHAMFEILYRPDIPNAAAINDAVEIAKGYENPKTVSFINGILGAFVRGECPPEPTALSAAPQTAAESPADGTEPEEKA